MPSTEADVFPSAPRSTKLISPRVERRTTLTGPAKAWPFKVEERDVGHMVDSTFVAHGLAWLRERKLAREGAAGEVRTSGSVRATE